MADEDLTHADDENVTEPQVTEPTVTEPTESQPTDTEKYRTRYRSPEEVFEENSRLQSELTKARNELKAKGVETTPPPQVPEEDLNEFVKDPSAYIKSQNADIVKELGDIKAQNTMNNFLSDPSNQKRFGGLKQRVIQGVDGNIAALADPTIMRMAFLYAEDEMNSAKTQAASAIQEGHRSDVRKVKEGDAFVEGSGTSQKSGSPKIVPGMSTQEMEKALDDMGIQEEPEK